MLTDLDHIRNLLGKYCERIDAGDFAGVGALFAHGSLAAGDGAAFAVGEDAVARFYDAGTQLHGGSPCTKHVVADLVVEPPEADGTVTVRSSYVVFQGLEGFPLQPIITGRYRDRFACSAEVGSDGGWHFVERRFFVDQVGDLSRHLADPGIASRG